MAECKRGTGPWQTHPKRMLRHKAMIQCARLAFGYGGIYDQDEAERIAEAQAHHPHTVNMGMAEVVPQQQPEWPADKWTAILPKMLQGIAQGKSVEDAMAWLRAKATVTPEQEQELRDAVAQAQQSTIDQDTGEIAPEADAEYTQTEE
jgi:hypothetical protein